jgi:hypothetical protein
MQFKSKAKFSQIWPPWSYVGPDLDVLLTSKGRTQDTFLVPPTQKCILSLQQHFPKFHPPEAMLVQIWTSYWRQMDVPKNYYCPLLIFTSKINHKDLLKSSNKQLEQVEYEIIFTFINKINFLSMCVCEWLKNLMECFKA